MSTARENGSLRVEFALQSRTVNFLCREITCGVRYHTLQEIERSYARTGPLAQRYRYGLATRAHLIAHDAFAFREARPLPR